MPAAPGVGIPAKLSTAVPSSVVVPSPTVCSTL